jgi:hypothetical protein
VTIRTTCTPISPASCRPAAASAAAIFDGDGVVDQQDLGILLANFGQECG